MKDETRISLYLQDLLDRIIALRDAGKNRREAAEALGIGRTRIYRITKRYNISGWQRDTAEAKRKRIEHLKLVRDGGLIAARQMQRLVAGFTDEEREVYRLYRRKGYTLAERLDVVRHLRSGGDVE